MLKGFQNQALEHLCNETNCSPTGQGICLVVGDGGSIPDCQAKTLKWSGLCQLYHLCSLNTNVKYNSLISIWVMSD